VPLPGSRPSPTRFLPSTDEDLAAMYLSDKKAGKPRQLADHEDLEVLLESFSKQVEELVNESETTLVSPPLWRLRATLHTRSSLRHHGLGEYPSTDLINPTFSHYPSRRIYNQPRRLWS